MCANCDDYSLCENCYKSQEYDHFSFHVFLKLLRALEQPELGNPKALLPALDPQLYPKDRKEE